MVKNENRGQDRNTSAAGDTSDLRCGALVPTTASAIHAPTCTCTGLQTSVRMQHIIYNVPLIPQTNYCAASIASTTSTARATKLECLPHALQDTVQLDSDAVVVLVDPPGVLCSMLYTTRTTCRPICGGSW